MILFLLVIVALFGGYAAAADKDLTQPVWVFLPTDTDPSNPSYTFATIQLAMATLNSQTAQKANNAVIELHGDTNETKTTVNPSYSVTIRSEAGFDHTVSYSSYSSVNPTFALRMQTAGRTITLGGGEGYGVLTFDFCGNLGGLTTSMGTVNIQNGVIFKNGSISEGAAIRMYSSGDTGPVVNIIGGSFINNSATKIGGAVCVAKGKLNISGGIFTGNTAEQGNAVYCGNTREVHVSGDPVFNEGQDIYIATTLSDDATNITALIKDGSITSTIPVTLGNEAKNIFGFRNVLVGGADTVIESDLEHFTIFNKDEVSAMYLKLGYNANDATKKAPVIELVTDFFSNFDNFIDNNFDPAPPAHAHGKSAQWLDDEKNQAEITIDESSSDGKTVLIIGSLCGAHGLTSDCIKTVINSAAKHNNVEYWFESETAGAKSQFDQGIAGMHRGPVTGTVLKGNTLKTTTFMTYSGAHTATGSMAKALTKLLQEKQYFEIIMVFDNVTITDQCYKALTPEEQKACYKAANMLVPYYNSDKVIWVSSGTSVMYYDYENHKGYSINPDKLLVEGCYTTDTSLYHYDINHVSSDGTKYGKYDKFNTYFTMALMDPATWLKGVKEKRIPEWSEYNINTSGVLYRNVDDIINFIGNQFFRDEIIISDVVADGLNIKESYLESSSDGGETWTKKTDNVDIRIEGQNVTCDITNMTEDTNIRLKIICDCPGEFRVGKDKPKDTNVGNAVIVYKKSGATKLSYELDSPQLLKILIDLIIKKNGMKEGESAIFNVSKTSDESNTLYTVTITAGADGNGSVTIKGFQKGEYTVQEEPWSWAYTSNPTDGKISQDISTNNVFTFTNTPNENIPRHAEAIKVNEMKRSVVGDVSVEGYKKKGDIHVKF